MFIDISVMYYSNTPRHNWTALEVMVEEMDPTLPQIFPLRQKIEDLQIELIKWDWIQKTYILEQKTIEIKKDFIKWEIRSLEHRIAKYICALTASVKENDWDDIRCTTKEKGWSKLDICKDFTGF